ncbi:MAG: hypothetical protein RB149_13625, partial [Armatimonadota bacterium]|nr:hypothetical protein [Armatimonadota bacterium]
MPDSRVLLSRLADPGARRAAGRWLLVACAAGFAATLAVLAAGGRLDRWVFALLAWGALVFVPLRILIEAAETFAARARRAVSAEAAADPRRYERAAYLPFVVAALADRAPPPPRICTPAHARAAAEAAAALLERVHRSGRDAEVHRGALRALVTAVAQSAADVSAAATGGAAGNIQARWEGARALGALSVLTSIVGAAFDDRWGRPADLPELNGRGLDDYLAAALDYCDEAALQVDALPWTEPPLPAAADARGVVASWQAFLAAGRPAPRALAAFLDALLAAA